MLSRWLPLVLLAALAMPVAAQDYDDPYVISPMPECQSYDDPNCAGSFGAKVYYCSANKRWGGYCVDCVYSFELKRMTCGKAEYDAACTCDINNGTCRPSGSCTFHNPQ